MKTLEDLRTSIDDRQCPRCYQTMRSQICKKSKYGIAQRYYIYKCENCGVLIDNDKPVDEIREYELKNILLEQNATP